MLTFIYKYIWIGMIVLAYAIWSVTSIKDIIITKHLYKYDFDIDDLNDSSVTWICVSIGIIFGGSFIYYWWIRLG